MPGQTVITTIQGRSAFWGLIHDMASSHQSGKNSRLLLEHQLLCLLSFVGSSLALSAPSSWRDRVSLSSSTEHWLCCSTSVCKPVSPVSDPPAGDPAATGSGKFPLSS